MSTATSSSRGAGGLTLLEVMAAVVVVGIAYVALFNASGESLLREGEAARRLEASLLADRVLADLESGFDRGLVESPGLREYAEGDFAIEVETREYPYLPPPLPREAPVEEAGAERASLLGNPQGRESSGLREVAVRVIWIERGFEREVVRRTLAFDPEGAQAVLEGLVQQRAAEAAAAGAPAAEETP